MSKNFDDIKHFLNDWWTKNGPKVEEMVKTTAEKAETMTQKARLKYDLYQAGRDLGKAFEALGEKIHHDMTVEKKFEFSSDDDVRVLLDRIEQAEQKTKEIKDELSSIGMTAEDNPLQEENEEDIISADVPESKETE
jgi:predicted hydrocarbon binding protein